ncbi:MAG: UDP-N-acetylglucosamine 2-epimerase (non-hydrolyzing) [Calditrichaeota bacterium]|nr:UDP-N-acetylglucosamine 2-epimerase (non-hydrolyzing) [Calditrichota bacterium]
MKIISVVGARPNFMKIAPFIREIECYNNQNGNSTDHVLVHTGQHYDDAMSRAFFEQLNIPEADINLGIGSGSHAEQVGKTMMEFEKVLLREKPDWVVVVGDVNATLACSVVAKKLWTKVCHIEAGLRSRDEKMPEEINRIVTDRLSDLLLTPDRLAIENLKKEGVSGKNIKFVGNIMIDTLDDNFEKAKELKIKDIVARNWISGEKNVSGDYVLLTLHRPSNVDEKSVLTSLIDLFFNEITKEHFLLWPVHPRTKKRLREFGLYEKVFSNSKIILLNPLTYHETVRLNMEAAVTLTDSGGLQEESTVLGTPCLTLRWNTERPVTLREYGGTCVLVGNDYEKIKKAFYKALSCPRKPQRPDLWDGNTAKRCVEAILEF